MPTGFPDYYGGLTLPLTVAEGGTGYTSIAAHSLLIGNGSGIPVLLAPGTAGYVLTSQGANADPAWAAVSSYVAGANISITGVAPNLTIAVVNAPVFSGDVTTQGRFWSKVDNEPSIILANAAGTAHWQLYEHTTDGTHQYISIFDNVAGIDRFAIDTAGNVSLSIPLAVAQGGTGTATPSLVAGTGISITGAWPNQTINVSNPAPHIEYGFVKITAGSTSGSATFGTSYAADPYFALGPESNLGGRSVWAFTSLTGITISISSTNATDLYIEFICVGT